MSSNAKHDVIVVGAGPAGSVLAYLLAKRGLDVLMVERAKLPRYKTCGGGVTWKAIQALPFDVSPVLEVKAVGGVVTYAGQQLLKAEMGEPAAWLVMRDRFDHFLAQQAVQAGARLLEKVSVSGVEESGDCVRLTTTQGELQAQLVAGADGVNSSVARAVGLLPYRQLGVALEAELGVSKEALAAQGAYATFDFGAMQGGYGWIFPKRDHFSVGVFKASARKVRGLNESLERFIQSERVIGEAEIFRLQGHQIPLGGRREVLHKGRVLLVGDAANLADPWLGEGISYAVVSARLAAEQMVQALIGKENDLSGYTRRVNELITPQFRAARLFARAVYTLPKFASNVLSRSTFLAEMMLDVIQGNRTFRRLVGEVLLGVPRVGMEMLSRRGEVRGRGTG